jgi:pre-mRNA-splicing helicase BRR2
MQVYGIKRCTISKPNQIVDMEIVIPTAGPHELTVWCMCDSYMDADKELKFEVNVARGEDEEIAE